MKKVYQQACLNFIYLASLCAIGLFSYIFYVEMKQVKLASDWVIHSHYIIEELYTVMSDINLAESKARGYFILPDEKFYADYVAVKKDVFDEIEKIKKISQDNPNIQNKLGQLSVYVQQRFTLVDLMMGYRKDHDLNYVIKLAEERKYIQLSGRTLSNQIHDLIISLVDEENIILEKRSHFALTYFSKMTMFVVYGTASCAVLLFICFVLLNRELLFRFRAQKKLRKSEKALIQVAYFDPISGLPNRAKLLSEMDHLLEQAKIKQTRLGLILLDIDNFKNINDSFGHKIGDELLGSFANLMSRFSDENHLMFHLSGDEFAIVVQNAQNKDEIVSLLQMILLATESPMSLYTHQLFVTCSMGVGFYPDDGMDAKELLKNTDIAMYRAKKLGKNTYQFCRPELILEVEGRALLEQQLFRAVQQKEFVLVYQPKVSLKTGKISGFEALMRWKAADSELVYPDQFIALAESNGLIVPIGEWLLRTVCLQVNQWHQEGMPENSVAINVSIRELSMPNFVERVARILQETHFDPRLLEIEITETILMNNTEKNLSVLRDLKSMGIKITIDDFGTGYSSLSYLHLFSIDKIKIDQSFVKEISTENHNSIIINAIILMAHSLGIEVVAEGVETVTQLNFLMKHHCDEVQGFYCSYPLAETEVHAFIKRDFDFLPAK